MRPEEYKERGCSLAADMYEIFCGIWALQQGNPCKGCGDFQECELRKEIYQQRNNPRPSSPQSMNVKDGITNAQVAKVLSISKRQAAKLRAKGALDLDDIKRKIR